MVSTEGDLHAGFALFTPQITMAESIAIHFFHSLWPEVEGYLSELGLHEVRGATSDADFWRFPSLEDYAVTVYSYEEIVDEYNELQLFFRYFEHNFPASTLGIELRRSKGNSACDVATQLTVALLRRFEGVVDDTYSEAEFWTLDEILGQVSKENGTFLECYRVR